MDHPSAFWIENIFASGSIKSWTSGLCRPMFSQSSTMLTSKARTTKSRKSALIFTPDFLGMGSTYTGVMGMQLAS